MDRYYSQLVARGRLPPAHDDPLIEVLLAHYQRSLVLSLNDFAIFVALVQNLPQVNTLLPDHAKLLEFTQQKEQAELFDASRKGRAVKFKGISYAP